VMVVTSYAAIFRLDAPLLAPHPKSMVPIAPVAPHDGKRWDPDHLAFGTG
jgi:hypothetical protein